MAQNNNRVVNRVIGRGLPGDLAVQVAEDLRVQQQELRRAAARVAAHVASKGWVVAAALGLAAVHYRDWTLLFLTALANLFAAIASDIAAELADDDDGVGYGRVLLAAIQPWLPGLSSVVVASLLRKLIGFFIVVGIALIVEDIKK